MTKAEKMLKSTEREMKKEAKKAGVHHEAGMNLGVLVMIIAAVWLAINQGWVPKDWPIWPVVLFMIGLLIWLSRPKH